MTQRCVLFDLDGTLVDTAPDLAWSLNALRAEEGLAPLPLAQIRPHVSHGARALVCAGFGIDAEDPRFAPLRQRLLDLYAGHVADDSRVFPGIDALLAAIESLDMRWGVVTNKPARFTEPLLAALGLATRAACIVSGDSTTHSKPHPQPLLHASRIAGIAPARCVYVGDAERDIIAGRRAGMPTLVALFGYLAVDDRPEDWQADGLVEHPLAILDWLTGPGRNSARGA